MVLFSRLKLLQVIFHIQNVWAFVCCIDECRHYAIASPDIRRELAALRLVNRTFCDSASVVLFRHIVALATSSPDSRPLERLTELANSRYASYVCHLELGFRDIMKFSTSPSISYIEDLAGLLSSCLIKFTNLRALQFREPPSCLPLERRRAYIKTVVSTLRYLPLPELTELELYFPITHDFGEFFPNTTSSLRIPVSNVLSHLRHLGLYVCEHTNHVDQRYWQEPILPEYATLPNTTHAFNLFKMIQSAPSLQSLAVRSRDILDLDYLRFPPTLRLRSLYLSGVRISSNNLLSLFKQSQGTIAFIDFSLVKLNSGTWQQIFMELCTFQHLLDFYIQHSGYSSAGSSSGLAAIMLPDPECSLSVESENTLDTNALGDLQRQVNANRISAGFPPCPETDYRYINLPPLETEMRYLQHLERRV